MAEGLGAKCTIVSKVHKAEDSVASMAVESDVGLLDVTKERSAGHTVHFTADLGYANESAACAVSEAADCVHLMEEEGAVIDVISHVEEEVSVRRI